MTLPGSAQRIASSPRTLTRKVWRSIARDLRTRRGNLVRGCQWALLVAIASCTPPLDEPPNVLLISIDSLRADRLSCYGYSKTTSPQLDRLAREGVLFETAIADSSWTLPTHVTLFTGAASQVHGVDWEDRRLGDQWTTLAEALSAEGYATAGYWSGPFLHPAFGVGQGFDRYAGTSGGQEAPESESPDGRSETTSFEHHDTVTSPEITRQALDYLANAKAPFFLFLHYFDVHYDYIPPEPIWRKFDANYEGDFVAEGFIFNEDIHAKMPRRERRHLDALYDGEIYYTDQFVGQVLEGLREHGLEENTLVVLTADHGEEFFEHGGKGHRLTLYDEVLEVPLMFRMPGRVVTGKQITTQVRHLDVMPTILDFVGAPTPDTVQGRSLRPVLEGEAALAPLPAPSFLKHGKMGTLTSLRTETWKLFYWDRAESEPLVFLHDLASDPREKRPLGADTPHSAIATQHLQAWQSEVDRRQQGFDATPLDEIPEDVLEELRELGYLDD